MDSAVIGPLLFILRLILMLALYAFIGWALLFLWQTYEFQIGAIIRPQAPPLMLTYILNEESKTARYTTPEVRIGRDPACDLHLEDKTISAHHARLCFHHGQWWVEDLQSTNGTYLNQEPVNEPVVLTDGDEVRCGQAILHINLTEPEKIGFAG